ncbi:MAG: hypothetical protein GXY80_12690 [Syntrophorhabdus aromaticivorans]|uniref:Uncharacterized protein n=1 Tax=Syntrophorhabdus aromaticivorans TaxID=328301 RepID=A0A971M5B1_9BACT|nr:hypothetical protein [Syntrophorhabdus aromaticivorans]
MFYEKILTYISLTEADENARYKSWDHCHTFFLEHKDYPEAKDLLSLHLAFYLASWGMLRGNAFLLQKDYRVHLPVVDILLDSHYSQLWNCSAELLRQAETLSLILECAQRIRSAYRNKTKFVNGKESSGAVASDTLVTKILLGTFGCTPAYDRYFCSGIVAVGLRPSSFGKGSLAALANLYMTHPDFAKAEETLRSKGFDYSPAKILDMCFWQIGYDLESTPDLVRLEIPKEANPVGEGHIVSAVGEAPVGTDAERVREYIHQQIQQSGLAGIPTIDLVAKEIGRALQMNNRYPTICNAMYRLMGPGDAVIYAPKSGKSSLVRIRYNTRR